MTSVEVPLKIREYYREVFHPSMRLLRRNIRVISGQKNINQSA